FFQAEDGIRDRNVTGVQTCALPIFHHLSLLSPLINLEKLHQEVLLAGGGIYDLFLFYIFSFVVLTYLKLNQYFHKGLEKFLPLLKQYLVAESLLQLFLCGQSRLLN